jgi:hypothetical protein
MGFCWKGDRNRVFWKGTKKKKWSILLRKLLVRTDILTIGIVEEQNGETTLIWQMKIILNVMIP